MSARFSAPIAVFAALNSLSTSVDEATRRSLPVFMVGRIEMYRDAPVRPERLVPPP